MPGHGVRHSQDDPTHLQGSDGSDDDDGVGFQAGDSTLDVTELYEGESLDQSTHPDPVDRKRPSNSLSIPISAPNPASVMTYPTRSASLPSSVPASLSAILSAMMEEFP